MKKIIFLIITVLLLVSCFSFAVGAKEVDDTKNWEVPFEEYCDLPANHNITFSDDLNTLYVGKQAYSRVNANDLYYDYAYLVPNLKIIDNEAIEEVDFSANKKGNVIFATFYYKDGSELSCSFMDDKYLEEFKEISKDKNSDLYIHFDLDDEEYYKVEAEKLKGKKVELKWKEFAYDSEWFSVMAFVSDKSIATEKGSIYVLADRVYFELSKDNADNSADENEIYKLYEVEDKELVEKIIAKKKQYYEDADYGLLMDEEALTVVSLVFFTIFFIILPFAVMIMAIIFALRSKKPMYKKMYTATSIIACAQAIVFVICWFILFK